VTEKKRMKEQRGAVRVEQPGLWAEGQVLPQRSLDARGDLRQK